MMKFKVLKPESFIPDTKLLGKYNLWKNTAMKPTHICHSEGFGDKDDMFFGTDNSFWAGFNTETKELEIECLAYGGMCGFEFTRETLKLEDLPDLDKECIEYTYKFIDDLKENGVIEDEI